MGPITNILFPVDFSLSCIAMAPYVKRAAALFAAKVSMIHVFDPASYNGFELYLRRPPEIAEEHEDIARNRLNSFLRAEFPVSEYPRILVAGDAAAQIAEVAKSGFDLIIMPTHAGTFRRMLLGSTTAKVLHDADCPVLTSKHAETIAPRPLEHREWLCAIGLDEDSERVLRYAHLAAAEADANLHIIHAVQGELSRFARSTGPCGRNPVAGKTAGASADCRSATKDWLAGAGLDRCRPHQGGAA
jgi:nucleotide-binding universal stress UspA family protein